MVLISKELLALYKEVQEYWEGGLQVPEDVTLLFAVDNFGSIRRLPVSTEASRRGRAGVSRRIVGLCLKFEAESFRYITT